MKHLNATGMKTLKVIHLLFVMIWLVGILGMWSLAWMMPTSRDALLMQLNSILWIDYTLTIPGAIATVVIGIVYGLFTNWGFFRHRWLTVKWIVSIAVILIGTFGFHPVCQQAVEAVAAGGNEVLAHPTVIKAANVSRYLSEWQAVALIVLVALSVFKPWKKKPRA